MKTSKNNLDALNSMLRLFRKEKGSVLLSTQRVDRNNNRTFLFLKPIAVIKTNCVSEIIPSLKKIEHFLERGFYAAGYLTYEAGLCFEKILEKNKQFNFPLLWFGIYKEPLIFCHKTLTFRGKQTPPRADLKNSSCEKGAYKITNPFFCMGEEQYENSLKRIKRFIERGDTYQVNFTFKYKFDFAGSSEKLFLDLSREQSVPYAAFIKHDSLEILSFSPELFFNKKGDKIVVEPMKGTISRGVNMEDDALKKDILKNNPKDKAENIMIVDLLRNDLGRIALSGRVKASKIFEVEKYETLFQMVSSIKANLKKGIKISEIFANLFPSGSVTGAPKIETMKIIERLEPCPRGIYTGSIGFISPGGESVFNVAIRTILINKKLHKGEMGIGSGIVYDSNPSEEYSECRLKARFLTKKKQEFSLIETLLWNNRFFLLRPHLNRLRASAVYFGFEFDRHKIMRFLKKKALLFDKGKKYRVRLALEKDGRMKAETDSIEPEAEKRLKVCFSAIKTDSKDIWLYHKTTCRRFYDKEYSECRRKGFDEVIFSNEKGQITEGAISNILIKKGKIFFTPPVSCGLLDGVYRQFLMRNKKMPLKEKILFDKDLREADNIYFINSVRGMREAHFS